MRLSVIIPIYNVEKYIEKCIFSVLNNNLSKEEYEIIIVDDASPDNSLAIAKEISNQYSNIKIISQENKGLGGARNTGILTAKGKYLLFLDSDDWYLQNTLLEILNKAEQNSVEVLEFGAQGISVNNKRIYEYKNSSHDKIMTGTEYCFKVHYMHSACNKMYLREFILENNLFFLERIYIEDFEFNTRVFFKAKKVLAVDNIVAQFLQSEDSITRNKSELKKDKIVNDLIHIVEKIDKLYKETELSDQKNREYFEERLAFLIVTLFYQFLKYRVSYVEIKKIRNQLIERGLYYVDFSIHDFRKNMFRIVFLKQFKLFKFLKYLF